jgi:hypothetical protein
MSLEGGIGMTRAELQEEVNLILKDENVTADVMKVFDGYIEGLPIDTLCRNYKLEHGSVCRYHCKFFDWSTGSCKWTDEQGRHPIK